MSSGSRAEQSAIIERATPSLVVASTLLVTTSRPKLDDVIIMHPTVLRHYEIEVQSCNAHDKKK